MSKKDTKKQRIGWLEDALSTQARRITDVSSVHNDLRNEINRLHNVAWDYSRAVGPLWVSQSGHRRPMGMLSTAHLQKMVEDGWLDSFPDHEKYAVSEISRRSIDYSCRKGMERPKPRTLLDRLLWRNK